MTHPIIRAATLAGVLTMSAIASTGCSTSHPASPAATVIQSPVSSPTVSAVVSEPASTNTAVASSPATSVTATVVSCAAVAGHDTAQLVVTNHTTEPVHVAVIVTVDGGIAAHLVRADAAQPPFGPSGIALDPGQSWRGSAAGTAGGGAPRCSAAVRLMP